MAVEPNSLFHSMNAFKSFCDTDAFTCFKAFLKSSILIGRTSSREIVHTFDKDLIGS